MNKVEVIHAGPSSICDLGQTINLDNYPDLKYEWAPELLRLAENSVLSRFRDCEVEVTEEDGRTAWELGLVCAHLGVSLKMSTNFSKAKGRGILSRTEYLDEMWRDGWRHGTHTDVAIVTPLP